MSVYLDVFALSDSFAGERLPTVRDKRQGWPTVSRRQVSPRGEASMVGCDRHSFPSL